MRLSPFSLRHYKMLGVICKHDLGFLPVFIYRFLVRFQFCNRELQQILVPRHCVLYVVVTCSVSSCSPFRSLISLPSISTCNKVYCSTQETIPSYLSSFIQSIRLATKLLYLASLLLTRHPVSPISCNSPPILPCNPHRRATMCNKTLHSV